LDAFSVTLTVPAFLAAADRLASVVRPTFATTATVPLRLTVVHEV
jgi:hypothetical protein